MLLELGDWQSLSDLLAYALKMNQPTSHALQVHALLKQQGQTMPCKRSGSDRGIFQSEVSHQPLVKRRHVTPSFTAVRTIADNSIELQQLTWISLAASIRQALHKVSDSGSAAAVAVKFVLPARGSMQQPEQQVTIEESPADSAMRDADPRALAAPEPHSATDTINQPADSQLLSDDAKEASGKPQRSSRRLGSSR